MEFIRPCTQFLSQYEKAIEEEKFRKFSGSSFSESSEIIEKSKNYELGLNLPAGHVQSTTFWLVDKHEFIGEIHIRHALTDELMKFGGHIGYIIRYSKQNRGYGTKMLQMGCNYTKEELSIQEILITCDDTNIGSIRVIEKNGGVLENKIVKENPKGAELVCRYWIK